MTDEKRLTHKWQPIEDLPSDWQSMAAADLAALGSVWVEQSDRLKGSNGLREFNDRIRRQWSIETGIIERIYSIDRGITNILIEKGIEASLIPHGSTDKPAEYIVDILRDHEHVLEGLFDFVGKGQPLSNFYIRQLHQALCRNQETTTGKDQFGRRQEIRLLKGEWKKLPNNPEREDGTVHEYCPPEQVASEMDRLIELHLVHVAQGIPPEIEAAWLHHRFSQIHPFQDGNGRVVRALASIVLLRAKWFPLVIDRDMRADYIRALEVADQGELAPLVQMFSKNMKRSFTKALSVAEEVLTSGESYRQLIGSAVDLLKKKEEAKKAAQSRVFAHSKALEDAADRQLTAVRQELDQALKPLDPDNHAKLWRSKPEQDYWYRYQVVELAKELEYFADLRTYHRWLHLKIVEKSVTDLVISFHPLGREFVGVMAASAYIDFRSKDSMPTEMEQELAGRMQSSCREAFEFSYNEDEADVVRRFDRWLGEVIMIALNEWRKQL
ncbi:Fic family protein [bacterium]|nr:Fic family protein [bacterium]